MPKDDVREYLHDGRFGTGMLYRDPDPKNFLISDIADVRTRMIIGYADRDEHLTPHVQYTYNQGASPSCVWHAISLSQTGSEHIERKGDTIIFDAMGMHLSTGPANEGRYTGDMLRIAQNDGTKVANSSLRYKIGSYAFAPKDTPQMFESTVKAAVAAGHICGLALLLPSTFGWESGGSIVPNSYHEVMIVGYRPDAFLIKNSWGASWGQNGFGWVPISFLTQQSYQNGYVFVNTILDAIDGDLEPPKPLPPDPPAPLPVRRIIVTGDLSGGGSENVAVGQTLPTVVQGWACQILVTDVDKRVDPGPDPDPGPGPGPGPDPDPSPGDLTVNLKVYKAGRITYADVTVTGQDTMPASLAWNVAGMLPLQVLVNGGLVRGRLANPIPGDVVEVTALNGVHKGTGRATVP